MHTSQKPYFVSDFGEHFICLMCCKRSGTLFTLTHVLSALWVYILTYLLSLLSFDRFKDPTDPHTEYNSYTISQFVKPILHCFLPLFYMLWQC